MKPSSPFEAKVRDLALSYPDATEDFPWGERAMKVKGKVFLFMRGDRDGISLSVKLPITHFQALALPFTEPTGYGLGKAGWVTAKFPASAEMYDQVAEWVDESYRAVAPKKLIAALDARTAAGAAAGAGKPAQSAARPAARRKTAKKASPAGKRRGPGSRD